MLLTSPKKTGGNAFNLAELTESGQNRPTMLADRRSPSAKRAAKLLHAVSEEFGVSPQALRGPTKTKQLQTPRWILLNLLVHDAGLNQSDAGAVVGRGHYSTMYALRYPIDRHQERVKNILRRADNDRQGVHQANLTERQNVVKRIAERHRKRAAGLRERIRQLESVVNALEALDFHPQQDPAKIARLQSAKRKLAK